VIRGCDINVLFRIQAEGDFLFRPLEQPPAAAYFTSSINALKPGNDFSMVL